MVGGGGGNSGHIIMVGGGVGNSDYIILGGGGGGDGLGDGEGTEVVS